MLAPRLTIKAFSHVSQFHQIHTGGNVRSWQNMGIWSSSGLFLILKEPITIVSREDAAQKNLSCPNHPRGN